MKLLLVSNGHGEDAIGARLAGELRGLRPDLELAAVPLVGRGRAYEEAGVRVLGPRLEMPSGGFMLTSPGALLGDVRAGFLGMSLAQYRAVKDAQPDAVVVVGDVYALWAATRFARTAGGGPPPVFQVQPLVSLRYQEGMTLRDRLERLNRTTVDGFVAAERRLMRRAEAVYARDEPSAAWLRAHGVPRARFAGNLMMDLVAEPELDLSGLADGRPVLALLPGTRGDHRFSLPLMLEVAARLPGFQALAAYGGGLADVALPAGWRWEEPAPLEEAASAGATAAGHGARVPVLRGAFAAVLHASSVVLGTAGTANEQAAGLGRPVVGFPTRGPQYLPAFARSQRRLLGAALALEPPEAGAIAAAARRAHENLAVREGARLAGLARMGGPGGARRVALEVLDKLSQRAPKREGAA